MDDTSMMPRSALRETSFTTRPPSPRGHAFAGLVERHNPAARRGRRGGRPKGKGHTVMRRTVAGA